MSTTSARSFTRLAAAIVIAAVVILAAALSYSATEATVTKTSTFTTTSMFTTTISTAVTVTETLNHTTTLSVYSAGRLVGTCATNNYLVPNTIQSSSVVTETSNGSTGSYTIYFSLTTTDFGGTSYTTTIYTNTTGTFTIYSTTTWYSSPSAGGTVTVCTFDG
jgi:hypothetical protein